MNGKVSILLPNLNYREYLEERMDSILNQTYKNWELIVVDSYSTDGAWELFQKYAQDDSRISISQAPRGLYQSWNLCLAQASGEYVYIATSDDTMLPDALAMMVQALEDFPDCGVCDSRLRIIDKDGKGQQVMEQGLAIHEYLSRTDLINKVHVRQWPHDFLLYFSGSTVFTSMAQVLLRKTIVDKVGHFSTSWGTMSDFNWGMKVAGLTSTVYLPQRLSTWRKHGKEATVNADSEQQRLRNTWNYEMAMSALEHVSLELDFSSSQRQFFEKQTRNLATAAYLDEMKKGGVARSIAALRSMYRLSERMTGRLIFNHLYKLLFAKDFYSPGRSMLDIGDAHDLPANVIYGTTRG